MLDEIGTKNKVGNNVYYTAVMSKFLNHAFGGTCVDSPLAECDQRLYKLKTLKALCGQLNNTCKNVEQRGGWNSIHCYLIKRSSNVCHIALHLERNKSNSKIDTTIHSIAFRLKKRSVKGNDSEITSDEKSCTAIINAIKEHTLIPCDIEDETLDVLPFYHCQHQSNEITEDQYIECLPKSITPNTKQSITEITTLTTGDILTTSSTVNQTDFIARNEETEVENKNVSKSTMTKDYQQKIGNKYFDALINETVVGETNKTLNDFIENKIGDIELNIQKSFAEQILKTTDKVMHRLACFVRNANASIEIEKTNLDAEAYAFDGKIDKFFQFPSSDSSISKKNLITFSNEIGLETMNISQQNCFLRFSAYGTIISNITDKLTDSKFFEINSALVGFSFGTENSSLPNNTKVVIRLQHLKTKTRGDIAKCVFWNYGIQDWSDNGCVLTFTSKTHTICECNHLTNFAVLMDIAGRETPSKAKSLLSVMCTTISSASLIITITAFFATEKQNTSNLVKPSEIARRKKITITINLCFVLLFLNLITTFGLQRTENATVCQGISMLLFYVISCTFLWMLLEGVIAYQMISSDLPKTGYIGSIFLYGIGYGISLLWFIIAVAVLGPRGFYNSEFNYFCWITQNANQWKMLTLFFPLLIICGANLIVITKSVIIVLKRRRNQITVNQRKTQRRRLLHGWLTLTTIFGLTWLTCILYIHSALYFTAYLFIFLNGLQARDI
ncbi:hypothetical protein B4U80_07576 [Leptotrombidium deliense]|uniref:Uncharacterized protein n=1 Tax=Leptotrombidium deliense TaxID=299467 RepID=A0A443S683_9ACAR|nr:hypothetical protein B4U80_07576 [Leptotrombidium deliense]